MRTSGNGSNLIPLTTERGGDMPRVKIKNKYRDDTEEFTNAFLSGMAVNRMTQAEIAKKTRLSQPTISRILKDIDNAKLSDLRSIADKIGVQIIIKRKGEES